MSSLESVEATACILITYNKAEQTGMHDVLGMLLNLVGVEIEPSGSVDGMMKITIDKGTDYLKIGI